MSSGFRLFAGIGIALILVGTSIASAAELPPTVILLSWDGTRWDYPDRTSLPALERLEREGVRAGRLIPVFPASTFPNHVSLATGTYVDRHGIVANEFVDPKLGAYSYSADASFIDAEPVWISAERQGLRAASFFWVGSETDWRGLGATYRRQPFDGDLGESEKVDQILAWLDLPPAKRPQLILSWWHGADGAGHRNGPNASQINTQLTQQDAELGRLLSGLDARDLWSTTTVLLVSDHGMTRAGATIGVIDLLEDAGIPAEMVGGTFFGYVTLDAPEQIPDALAALKTTRDLEVFRSSALPERLRARHATRTGHLTVISKPPRTLAGGLGPLNLALISLANFFGWGLGGHGYLPEHPDMHAVFYAAGRCVSADMKLESVRAIDVAPTVTALLGIEPPVHSEGRSVLPADCR